MVGRALGERTSEDVLKNLYMKTQRFIRNISLGIFGIPQFFAVSTMGVDN